MGTRRKYPRYDFSQTGLLADRKNIYRIRFVNISLGGIAFTHPRGCYLPIGSNVMIYAYEKTTDSMLTLNINIRHNSPDGKMSGGKLTNSCRQFLDVVRVCQQEKANVG